MNTSEIQALLPYVPAKEREELFRLLQADKTIWRPLPGPQFDAFNSKADVIGYGGAAGGGKTDLACGLALTQHHRTLIVRREATQLQGIYERLAEIIGSRDGFNSTDRMWRTNKRLVQFGSTPNPGDEQKYQGQPHDLKVFDEATGQLEHQVRFIMGWNRTNQPNQRIRTLMTFNPPTTSEGRWVISFFAPWLDDKHPNPAKPGELRWFATVANVDMEVESSAVFVLKDDQPIYDFNPKDYAPEEVIQPKSRTFIPSRVSDNPYYMNTGYVSTLQSLPEPLRSQMLNGDFAAGIEDDPWQVIPTLWVDMAMARWQLREVQKGTMDSMGVDVSRGGRDETVIARRHGVWFDRLVRFPGSASPDGPTVMGHVLGVRRDNAPVHLDVIGVGASPYDFLKQNNIQTIAVDNRQRSGLTTADGTLSFVNVRAQDWWRMREALDPTQDDPVALPPDTKLRADLCAPLWKHVPGGIQIEDKEQVKKRIGRSPDDGDAVVMALRSTPKQGYGNDRAKRRSNYRSQWVG